MILIFVRTRPTSLAGTGIRPYFGESGFAPTGDNSTLLPPLGVVARTDLSLAQGRHGPAVAGIMNEIETAGHSDSSSAGYVAEGTPSPCTGGSRQHKGHIGVFSLGTRI